MTDSPLPGATPLPEVVRRRVDAAVAARGAQDVAARAHHRDADGRPRFSNRLALESSPYLLQHAHNPVNWFPWGEEAFAEAARLARPIFLSVGYSTCHWCHVMERESFEDEEIAAFMNEHYVAIKVDREERPDVDAVYMSAVQQLTGSGGWPMSVWLTPAREPFFGGTYFPPRTGVRGSRHGFLALLGDLADTYRREPERVTHAAHSLVEAVRRDMEGARDEVEEGEEGGVVPGRQAIDQAVAYCKRSFDSVHGGLRRSPKFPSNVPLRLLLRHYHRTHDLEALQVALLTLEKMAGGGIYDQLGGGFHRYSTDGEWLVPHFEKMLYDNALLVVAYAEAFQLTGQAHLSRIVRETCDYVLREMTASDGGFYAATDADSEGHEGKFFVWSADEIRSVLTAAGRADDIEAFFQHYDVTPAGNWDGSTILRVRRPDEAMWARLTEARAVLYRHRAQRVPPLRDEKILSAWNGLMISALAIAGRILDEPRYRDAARRAAEFVLTRLHDDAGQLLRSFKGAPTAQPGFLDDYAFVAAGLIELYQATFESRYLAEALRLAEATERLFADPHGGWFMTGSVHETLIARERPTQDGAEPSGSSVALMNVLRLAAYTDDPRWRAIAERGFRSFATILGDRSMAMTEALLALDDYWSVSREIVLVWPEGGSRTDAEPFLSVLRQTYLRAWSIAAGTPPELASLSGMVPFVREKTAPGGHTTAYVCRHGACELPTVLPLEFQVQLASHAA
jgi:uncharacterized protein YyaL (SSP411 family)